MHFMHFHDMTVASPLTYKSAGISFSELNLSSCYETSDARNCNATFILIWRKNHVRPVYCRNVCMSQKASPITETYSFRDLSRALFLCNICVVFRLVVSFGKLLFIHASTNATDDHKYSPLPSTDFDSSDVLVSFSALIFS